MIVPAFKSSTVLLATVTILVASAIYLSWLWQPDRQLEKHQENLIQAVESRKAKRVGRFLSSRYADPWNESGDDAMAKIGAVMRNFFALSVREDRVSFSRDGNRGTIESHLSLDGRGTAFAEVIRREANGLTQPFTFHWQRESWKPWDWKLQRVENPSLNIDRTNAFW